MAVPNRPAAQNKYSPQYMQNSSFDEDYGVNAVELLGEFSGSLKRLQTDTNGNLKTVITGGGDATAANQVAEQTLIGAVNETAPATDTASSGLNGRLQRIAQRITSLIALLPTALGAGGGLKVDGSGTALPISGTVTANVAAGTNNIGDVDVLTVPSDPFGANADAAVAAGATGSIQAKLRRATQGLEDLKSLIVLAAGTNAIGKLAANNGVDIGDVDVTSISAGTNLIGDVGIQPRTTNGLDTFMASGSDGSTILVATAQAVKASAGKVYGYYLYNPEAAVTFVHFYNTAQGSVVVGTTNPLLTLAIPAGSAANLMSDIGITFSTAITIAATTTAGGNTAPSTGVSAVIFYK